MPATKGRTRAKKTVTTVKSTAGLFPSTVQLCTIGPDEAGVLLGYNTFAGQRTIRPRHVASLARKMQDGRFLRGEIALAKTGDGEPILMNGQHQLKACLAAGVPFEATVQTFECNGAAPGDLAQLHSQFDVGKPKLRGDIAVIYGTHIGFEVPNRLLKMACSAFANLEGGDYRKSRLSLDECGHLLTVPANQRCLSWLHDRGMINERHMRRDPVVAAMIVTWRKNHKAATEFWDAVISGESLKRSDPRHKLRDFLLQCILNSTGVRPGDRNITTNHAVYAKSIHAWNAWRKDRSTNLKYHASAPTPKPV